jgi:hypothetical protein
MDFDRQKTQRSVWSSHPDRSSLPRFQEEFELDSESGACVSGDHKKATRRVQDDKDCPAYSRRILGNRGFSSHRLRQSTSFDGGEHGSTFFLKDINPKEPNDRR